jgi:hypothetical protein
MNGFRVEAAFDSGSGMYYAELYYPADNPTARARTKPLWHTKEEAAMAMLEKMREHFPDDPFKVTRIT